MSEMLSGVSSAPPVRSTTFVGRWPRVPFEEMPEVMPSGTFSPTTATLITGETEALLVDALYLTQDVEDLGDLIERTGKRLTTIVVTHAHPDHYLGAGRLMQRFPDARYVALPEIVDSMRETMEDLADQWDILFGDSCEKSDALPSPLLDQPSEEHAAATLTVDGVAVHVVPVAQADIHPTSIVHVPSIGLVVAGDSIYNEIHPMLGLSGPEEWDQWLATIDFIESLGATTIVAGHRRPDGNDQDTERMIAETRAYIRAFAETFGSVNGADELVDAMTTRFPHHGNVWTLQFSALNAVASRDPNLHLAGGAST